MPDIRPGTPSLAKASQYSAPHQIDRSTCHGRSIAPRRSPDPRPAGNGRRFRRSATGRHNSRQVIESAVPDGFDGRAVGGDPTRDLGAGAVRSTPTAPDQDIAQLTARDIRLELGKGRGWITAAEATHRHDRHAAGELDRAGLVGTIDGDDPGRAAAIGDEVLDERRVDLAAVARSTGGGTTVAAGEGAVGAVGTALETAGGAATAETGSAGPIDGRRSRRRIATRV